MRAYPYFHLKLLLVLAAIAFSIAFLNRYKELNQPNIILITAPKSGSSFLELTFKNNLKYRLGTIYSRYNFQTKRFSNNFPTFFKKNRTINKNHLMAPINLQPQNNKPKLAAMDLKALRLYTNKVVVHVRDPRQLLLSQLHHIEVYPESMFIATEFRPTYLQMTFDEKVAWGIDNLLPNIVAWLNGWKVTKEQEDKKSRGMRILITSYEDILQDEQALYTKILKFYGIKNPGVFKAPKKSEKVKFRKGDPNEYKAVFSREQLEQINAMIPDSLLTYYHWQRNMEA